MNRSTILRLLSEHLAEVRERYRVNRLALFGFAARDELRVDSNIDILVEFDGETTFDRYLDLQAYLDGRLLQTCRPRDGKGVEGPRPSPCRGSDSCRGAGFSTSTT